MTSQVMMQLYHRIIYSLYENISSTNSCLKVLTVGMYCNDAYLSLFQKHQLFILIKFPLYMYMVRGV